MSAVEVVAALKRRDFAASKQQRAHEWMEFLWDTKRGRVSQAAGCDGVEGESPGRR